MQKNHPVTENAKCLKRSEDFFHIKQFICTVNKLLVNCSFQLTVQTIVSAQSIEMSKNHTYSKISRPIFLTNTILSFHIRDRKQAVDELSEKKIEDKICFLLLLIYVPILKIECGSGNQ